MTSHESRHNRTAGLDRGKVTDEQDAPYLVLDQVPLNAPLLNQLPNAIMIIKKENRSKQDQERNQSRTEQQEKSYFYTATQSSAFPFPPTEASSSLIFPSPPNDDVDDDVECCPRSHPPNSHPPPPHQGAVSLRPLPVTAHYQTPYPSVPNPMGIHH
jgi:hypothetical protein